MAILLTDMVKAQKPSDLEFFALPLWARIYDIPFRGRCNESNARMMGIKLGSIWKWISRIVWEWKNPDSLGMEKSLRIRVRLDVRRPLKKHVSIKIRGGEICTCPVKYEKLPMICFYCRKLGHGTNDCKDVFGDNSPVKNFCLWLKASPLKPVVQDDMKEEQEVKQLCGRWLFFSKKPI